MMKVVTSEDDEWLVNAYLDGDATKDWQNNTRRYFCKHCEDGNFEERE